MNIISRYIDWILSIKNLHSFNNTKSVLLYTNIIFIITIILVLIYKKNIKNNRIKHYMALIMLFLMTIISYKYHDCQCYSNKETKIFKWQKIDIIWSLILTVFFFTLYFKNINFYVLFLSGISLFLFLTPSPHNDFQYVIFHSLWHITIGIICLLLIIND